jgi:hypothetical protein
MGTPHVPATVAKAEGLVRDAMPLYDEACAAVKAAELELRAAPRLDGQRDAAALGAGQPAPTDRLEAAAAEALRAARQHQAATSELLCQRQIDFAHAVSAAHESWSADQDQIVQEPEQHALELMAKLGHAVDALSAARSVKAGLENWPAAGESLYLSNVRFFKTPEKFQQLDREQAEERLSSADRQGFQSAQQVDRTPVELFAALKAEIAGRTPRGSSRVPDSD